MTIRNQYAKWVGGKLFSMSFKATLVFLGAVALMALVPATGFAQRLDGTLQVEVTDKGYLRFSELAAGRLYGRGEQGRIQ
jgi:hypothetical protein